MKTLWGVWQQTATAHPEKVVVTEFESGRAWTCTQLAGAAEKLAPTLTGKIVSFQLPNSAEWLIRFLAIQKLGAAAAPLDPSQPATAIPPVANVRRFSVLKLTSGTTGQFKPIPCTAANLIADGKQICATMGIKPSDINLALIPLGHSYGIGNLVMPLLLQATPVVCATAFVPRQILEMIRRHHVTVFPTVPAVLRALVQLPHAATPPSLRLVISAGAPLAAELAQRFHEKFGVKVHNFYGASETGGICYDCTGTGRGVGKPLKGVRVTIRKDGRVAVAGRAVIGSGRFVLADRGQWNGRGELELIGRVGVVANIGGKKVSPAEVERALRAVAGVTDAWVTVLKDARGNDYLGAAVETSRSEVDSVLREKLPVWQLPKRYFLARALPRTARGKLDTARLRHAL